jgi:hypothetical protein
MDRIALTVAIASFLMTTIGLARAEDDFEQVTVRFEQNIADRDVEVVFEATSDAAGLSALKIVAPDGRTVVDYRSPGSTLGIKHFKLESPELKNTGSVKKDFPEGEYTFTGVTVTGVTLRGSAMLSHQLPEAPAIVRPRPEGKGVPTQGLQIRWDVSTKPAGVVIDIEQEKTGRKLSAALPGTATTFNVPDGFLSPGTEYKLAIGSVSREGNMSVLEIDFTTGGKQ